MRIGSICSGIGGLERGLELANVGTTIWQIEQDEYCRKVLARHWPKANRSITDVCEASASNLDPIDILCGGPPCFVAGTMVLTELGYIPIEDVRVGNLVLTHKGEWRKVYATSVSVAAETIKVSSSGRLPLQTTQEHPFLSRQQGRQWNTNPRGYKRTFTDPTWCEAGSLQTGMWVTGVVSKQSHTLGTDDNPDLWWCVGRYLADGWYTSTGKGSHVGRVLICCRQDEEEELVSRIKGAGLTCCRTVDKGMVRLQLPTNFFRLVVHFGRYAYGKRLPKTIVDLPPHLARSVVDGWISGDGYQDTEHGERRGTTVSKALALGMSDLIARGFGVVAGVRMVSVPPTKIIEGRTVNQRPFYVVTQPIRNRQNFVDDIYSWRRVRSTSVIQQEVTVYNLSVEEDESYVSEGHVVHNCQPASVAGKRQGSSDKRWLWGEALRLVEELRPSVCVFENPTGLVSLDGGRAFYRIVSEIASFGYVISWHRLRASDVGAPHRRERVFIVAHR